MGVGAAVASVALGATVIEKHFTLARADGGVDSTFSMEPQEMAQLVIESERAWQALGRVQNGSTQAEEASRMFRRSLYVVRDVKAGEVLTRDNVQAIRPGLGLPPKYLDGLLGRRINRLIKKGTPVTWELFS
jgi:N-acetylneuraminate synthase